MKVVFLDRDGVINQNPQEHDYVKSWPEFVFLPGVKKALKQLADNNYSVIVVSNQSGINKGIISHKTVQEINRRMLREVTHAGGRIERVYYCPHRPDENCNCRKPRPGLFLQAANDYHLDLKGTYFIGDLASDIEAGHLLGLRMIFISEDGKWKGRLKPDYVVTDLPQAVKLILDGKTILMISPFARPNVGGVEAHLEKLSRYLVANDFKVYLLTYQPLTTKARGPKIERDEKLEIHRVTWFGRGLFPILEPYFPLVFVYLFPGLFLKSLLFYLKRHKEIDVIHAHGLVAASITKILTKIHPKKSVVSTHAIYNLTQRRLLASLVRWLLCSFDKILAVGEPSRKELIQIGLPEAKITIHPNWIDLDFYRPLDRNDCRRRLQLPAGDFIILFLGRFIKKKGFEVLLAAARQVNPKIKFVFIGDGPGAEVIKRASHQQKNVIFIGKIPEEERYKIVRAYNAADLFVAPVQYEEGFATVYLEAIACGTPVITSNRGCLPSFLNSEVADLIEPTVENVTHRIEYYFQEKNQLLKKTNNCRRYAQDNFSERNAKVIVEGYGYGYTFRKAR